jgi:HlyD family secretion protein
MKRRIPLIMLLAAVVATIFYFYPRLHQSPAPSNKVTLSGNIEAHESLVSFKVSGRIVELPIEEGQWVTSGSLLARLDDADYKQKVEIDAANVKLRESNLALTLAGTRQQEIKAAEQAVIDTQAELEQRKIDNERAQRLYARDAISAQDRDVAATALKRSEAQYQSAKEKFSQAKEGSRKEDIAIARASVESAREALGLSRINLDYATLHAPGNGVVTVRQAELGEVVSPGTPVVTLADLDHVWLRAYVAETDLGRIRWGQDATIRTDTYPDKTYHGRISFISSNAEFTPKSVQTYKERVTLVYRIKVDIDNPNHELKPGMPADAEIEFAPESRQERSQAARPRRSDD